MSRGTKLIPLGIALVSSIVLATTAAASSEREVVLAFTPDVLRFPDGHQVTDEFVGAGVLFSTRDDDLPSSYQLSLGPQENVVRDSPGPLASLTNPFRITFIPERVWSVTLSIEDANTNNQTHTLIAFDSDGDVVDTAAHIDGVQGDTAGVESLTVSAAKHTKKDAIAFVVAVEQPFGAERLLELRYVTKSKQS